MLKGLIEYIQTVKLLRCGMNPKLSFWGGDSFLTARLVSFFNCKCYLYNLKELKGEELSEL